MNSPRTPRTPKIFANNVNVNANANTDEQNEEIVRLGLMVFAAAIAFRVLTTVLSSLFYLLAPLAYFYFTQTCPKVEHFDGRKELKRVLRGNHLPENHKDKPKSFLEQLSAKVTASVTTELATLPGYELQLMPLFDPIPAARLSIMTVPTMKMQYYWLGFNGQWYFLYSREVSDP